MQKCVTSANKLPQKGHLKQFANHSAQTSNSILAARRELKAHIKSVAQIQKEMLSVSKSTIKHQSLGDDMWTALESNFNAILPFVEGTISRWQQ